MAALSLEYVRMLADRPMSDPTEQVQQILRVYEIIEDIRIRAVRGEMDRDRALDALKKIANEVNFTCVLLEIPIDDYDLLQDEG